MQWIDELDHAQQPVDRYVLNWLVLSLLPPCLTARRVRTPSGEGFGFENSRITTLAHRLQEYWLQTHRSGVFEGEYIVVQFPGALGVTCGVNMFMGYSYVGLCRGGA